MDRISVRRIGNFRKSMGDDFAELRPRSQNTKRECLAIYSRTAVASSVLQSGSRSRRRFLERVIVAEQQHNDHRYDGKSGDQQ